MIKKILVLCTCNSCRSQMAEGYLKYFVKGRADIYSAGIETHGVNPLAVVIMKEDGIDISNHTSNNIEEYKEISFDFVITVCDNAKERCPFFPTNAKNFIIIFQTLQKYLAQKRKLYYNSKRLDNLLKITAKSL